MALFAKFSPGVRGDDERTDLRSIVDNLNNLLNTKRDYGSPLPDFGVRDLSEHRNRDDIALAVIQEVKECIDLYEPRVTLEQIAFEDDDNPMRLSFTIKCSVRRTARTLHMTFDTVFGNMAVTGPSDEQV